MSFIRLRELDCFDTRRILAQSESAFELRDTRTTKRICKAKKHSSLVDKSWKSTLPLHLVV